MTDTGVASCRFLFVVLLLSLPVFSPETALAQSRIEEFHAFPVTQYSKPRASQTGNNNYFAMVSGTERNRILVASSGMEDLLLYSGHTFQTVSHDELIYYQAIDLLPGNEDALMAGSKTPPDTGGVLVRYDGTTRDLSVRQKVPQNLMGLSVNSDGVALLTGGNILPDHRGVVYRYRDNQLERLPIPDGTIYHDVEWHDDGSMALLAGEKGRVLIWRGEDDYQRKQLSRSTLLQAIDWHPDGDRALIGGMNGTLYLYESGEFTRITSDINWDIQDIAWHPEENFALLAGGEGKGDEGYWGVYRQFRTSSRQLSGPLFSVGWLDGNNALIGGQKVLWRLSRNHTAEDFGLTAALSVSDTSPQVSEPVELSGFGSTYHASADSITAYRFHYGTGDSTGWQNEPNQTIEYLAPGQYQPSLDVRAGGTEAVATRSVTLNVGAASGAESSRGIDFYYWLTFAVFIASLTVAYVTLRS